MTTKQLLLASVLGAAGLAASHLVDPTTAAAQSNTTGAIQGVIADADSGEPIPGVTVTVTSPSLQGAQTAISDDKGVYKIAELPPGEYLVTFYYLELTIEHGGVNVGIQKTTPVYQKLSTKAAENKGEKIIVKDTAPTIDPTSTQQGITIDKNYIKNVPVPGRTFDSTLGAAAGSQSDGLGVSFSGSTSLENQYYVDGVNTTGLTFGTVGSPVINDFIEEIEVITGGYNAEYGRATGGVVNVVTKTGSNEFKGSIFGTLTPGVLSAGAESTPTNTSSIALTPNNAYLADFGFELGGPIIKDKLWFFVGFAPAFSRTDWTRDILRQTDCRQVQANGSLSDCDPRSITDGGHADGVPDVDPKTGFYINDLVDSEVRSYNTSIYNIVGKLNYAANPENQGQLTFQALPGSARRPGLAGLPSSGYDINQLTTDLSAKWTSKFNDNKTELEAVVGWHRDQVHVDSIDPALETTTRQVLTDGKLGVWADPRSGLGGESQRTFDLCRDDATGMNDVYPNITNCPISSPYAYTIGGPGSVTRDREERRSAKLGLTQRVKAAGSHEIKAGVDAEDNISDKTRLFSGGAFYINHVGSFVDVTRWVQLGQRLPDATDDTCNTKDPFSNPAKPTEIHYMCNPLGGALGDPGTQIVGNTFNWSAYIRDSWQIQPNLTINYGLRYEEQRMRYADFLQNTTDPLTGDPLGKNAMNLTGMFAPRIGIIYDWTKEGRSKIYANWGRYYENIPMDINDRSFGGEVTYQQLFSSGACGMADPKLGGADGNGCLTSGNKDGFHQLIGANGVFVAPDIQAEYMDETVAGFEYEILDDLKIGLSYQNRRLGRVIEDVSTDGANTYIIANPGEFNTQAENDFIDKINNASDATTKARLQHELDLLKGIRIFDKPSRDYNALQFTITRRFSKSLYIQGSYTYSRVQGNYPGSFSPDNGQVDPNISSQYDLIELLANRNGPLPTDRPHYIKLDGYYTFDFKKQGDLTVGIRLRANSGRPENALGSHFLYGSNESFLLPRGELGRADFDHNLDLHVGYRRPLNRKNMSLELYFDIFNVYDHQGTADVDNTYAPAQAQANASSGPGAVGAVQNANPVSGGTYEDLIWLKQIDQSGNETGNPIGRNPNFHNTTARYFPTSARIGMRLTF